jgi:lactobin A/cerein 7B family class IIb bacteriocin
MTNLDLNALGVSEMNVAEMQEVDGGFIPLIIIGIGLLLTGCIDNRKYYNNNGDVIEGHGNNSGNGSGNGNGSGGK